jgi:hypothetical protein
LSTAIVDRPNLFAVAQLQEMKCVCPGNHLGSLAIALTDTKTLDMIRGSEFVPRSNEGCVECLDWT